jgi:glycerol-3-phosphate dehydrogenase (NAD(P)+)
MICIFGKGAWGGALAETLGDKNPVHCGRGEEARVAGADIVLLAVPAQEIRGVGRSLAPQLKSDAALVICAKGLELAGGKTLDLVVREEAGRQIIAILSGPNFAAEIAAGKPAAATLACGDAERAADLAVALSAPQFRLYHSCDVTGVAIGGALKNVIAIACGIVIGKGLGENARAALMTRGLAEMTRLAVKRGGQAETLMGLSGLGDLALTASSEQSRNFSFGVRLGKGEAVISAARGALVEGAATANAALKLAAAHEIELPIAGAVSAILEGSASIDQAVAGLLGRPLKMETAY